MHARHNLGCSVDSAAFELPVPADLLKALLAK
jgi:hypothetical protein